MTTARPQQVGTFSMNNEGPKIVTRPLVYLLQRPSFSEAALQDFLTQNNLTHSVDESATPAERIAETCGRVCYMSFDKRKELIRYPVSKYIENIIAKGHESVLEHACWTFILDGVSRNFTHQLVRHRVGFSFSQLSQQYHDESKAKFVAPYEVSQDPTLLAVKK